jgi:1-acyl-sn-glycerol-3-phosphate acyltransferase
MEMLQRSSNTAVCGLAGTLASAARTAAVLASTPLLSVVCAARLWSREVAQALFVRWCWLAVRLLGIDVQIEDENEPGAAGPCVYVLLNQSSLIEVLVWMRVIPSPFVSVINLEWALAPFVGWATWAAGGIAIVRQVAAHARRGLDDAEQRLRAGDNVLISIEGRRSEDGELSPFKKGPVLLGLRTGAPLQPLIFHGARERLPRGSFLVRPGSVRVKKCRRLDTRALSLEHRHELVEQLTQLAQRELRTDR